MYSAALLLQQARCILGGYDVAVHAAHHEGIGEALGHNAVRASSALAREVKLP